tara:strand:+ start:450 stop:1085 length:636 start_codon:yes stop_codon:yes gene_type:complete
LSKQSHKDKKQDKHRIFNSILIIGIFICSVFAGYSVRDQFDVVEEKNIAVVEQLVEVDNRFNELSTEQHRTSEISQLMVDEGFRKCVYDDSRGLATIGFGHLMLPTDTYKCITYRQAIELLRSDYDYAANSVDNKYHWAFGEVRLVLINMTYQMGQTGVSKFVKTLGYLREETYDEAAIELLESRWASQTNSRALRLAGRIMAISVQEGAK